MATVRQLGFSIFSRYDGSGVTRARRDIEGFDGSVSKSSSGLNSWSARILLASKAAGVFGPALVPIGAHLIAIGGAATAMAVSVGVAMGAYGLAVKNAIKTTQEMAKAGKTLSAAQKDYIKSQEAFNKALANFGHSFRDETLKAVSATLRGMTNILKGLEPVAKALAPEVTKVAQAFEKWTKGDSFKNYVKLIKDSAVPAFKDLVAAGKDIINVLGDGFKAFLPQGAGLTKSLKDGAAALRQWSDNGGFQKFLQYVKDNAPQVKEFFRTLGDALKVVSKAMKDLGPFALGITTTILKLVAALPPSWIEAIVKGFVAWRVATLAWAVATGIAAAAQLALTIAASPFLLLMAGAALTILLVVAAMAALAVGIYFLVTQWDAVASGFVTAWNATWNGVKMVVLTVWRWMQMTWDIITRGFIVAWQAVSGALVTAWNWVWNLVKTVAEAVWNFLTGKWGWLIAVIGPLGWLIAIATHWSLVWNAIKLVAETVWNALKFAWDAFINGLQLIWTTVSTALITAWNAVWTALSVAASAVWTALQLAWNTFINGLQVIWTAVSAALTAAWNAVWTALSTAAQAVWTALQAAWNAFITALQTVWTTVSAALTTAWNFVWTALQTAAQAVWTAMQAAWQVFVTALQAAWTVFSTVFTVAWNLFWTALKTAAQLVWTALQLAWQVFVTAVQTVWTTFTTIFTTAWSTFWTALQTAAQVVWDLIKAAWDAFTGAINAAWDAAKVILETAWETVWNSLKETADKLWHEIGEVIQDAINGIIGLINGIGDKINMISSKVGLGDIIPHVDDVNLNFANGGIVGGTPSFAAGGTVNFSKGGGVLPGYAPGRDTVPAMLSRGEGVLVPEAVRGLGTDFVHWANSHFSGGRGGKRVGSAAAPSASFAEGGAVKVSGGIQAWHRSGPDPGWSFAKGGILPGFAPGGLVSEVPVPGGGTVGQTPGKDVNKPSFSILDALPNDLPDPGDLLGSIAGIGGINSMVLGFLGREAIEKMFDPIFGMLDGWGMAGEFGKVLVAAAKKLIEAAMEMLIKKDEEAKKEYESHAVAGSQSVQAWAGLAAQALKMAGLDPGQLGAFLSLMQAESGGNPNAINGTDINAKNGVPSQGLMQVIPPTFAAYHVAGTSNNILDPLANMAASAAYIKSRYGGRVPGSPYADGTDNATPGMHLVGENGPELVTGPGYAQFGGGEQVLPAPDTAALLSGGAGAAPAAGGGTGAMAAPADGGSPLGSVGDVGDSAEVQAMIQGLIESSAVLQAAITTMWARVVASTNAGWQAMNSQALTPLAAKLTGAIPASLAIMQAAFVTGMTALSAGTTAQWTALDAAAFTPMNAMMTTTVPTSATAMGEGVTASTTQMQGSVQGSWDQMQTGTETSWTAIETSISDSVTAATTPINGLLTGFNNVSSSLGMGVNVPLIAFSEGGVAGLAKGGVLPGYAPGRDTIPAMLSKGEGILTPEAVRGLGGPGFVNGANRKFAGHRGAGKGPCNGFAFGGIAHFAAGGTVTGQDMAGLADAGISPGLVTQGSFSTGVAASAGTHDGDGVVDLGSTDTGNESALRNAGWAAWIRGNGDGMSPHTHAVYMKATGIAPAAMGQVLDYINGGTGLGVGGASSGDLAGWGLGLGEWNFGPLIKDLVNLTKTNVPERLRNIVLKKLTGAQVTDGFAEKKSALDAMSVGTGPWADGLHGMGNKSHQGVVDYISSKAAGGAKAFDQGGWMPPGFSTIFNGTGKPELATPADDISELADSIRSGGAGHGDCLHVEFNFNGPVTSPADVRRAADEAIPRLRSAVQAGSGKKRVGG
ncbi:transglycosylase SLT domain-containing protein [Streptomyces sp. NPDC058471]|uniref:transglycosylase SLT domain-containing protein n=1 Tax=Streptomyces sp. NPDC058471 TaxID=3346516 RepID=UPI00364D4246